MKLHAHWPIKLPVGRLRWGVAVAMTIALVLPTAASGQTLSRVGGSFLFGANMPWLNWNADFGGGPNGGGVSGNTAQVDAKLQAAHNAGMRMVRWWVFEGGSPQIQRDASGTPTGLNPNVYTDLDAALTEAAKYGISYDLVLFGTTTDDSTTHQWWEDSAKRQALVRVLTPLFQRYAANPRVHTWEIVNEPEWQSRNGQTSVAGMLATGDAIANAVHQNSHALVTVGNAQVQDMATWKGHPLDYYSPHYYDGFGTGSNDPFVNAANSPDGKPVVIGEFQASTGLSPSAAARWQALYAGGYAGGWNWSLSPEHTGDQIPTDLNAAASFSAGKGDLGPGGAAPPPASTPTPVATATRVPATATRVPATATRAPATATRVPATPTRTAVPISTATRVPPTRTPLPTATSTVPTPQWSVTAKVSPNSVTRGSTAQVQAQVTARQNSTAIVDVEIYDHAWNRVYQRTWENQAFVASTARAYTTTWTAPSTAASGTYTVMVGTFAPGWTSVYSFNNNAATFIVP
jgi:hypothetical protein